MICGLLANARAGLAEAIGRLQEKSSKTQTGILVRALQICAWEIPQKVVFLKYHLLKYFYTGLTLIGMRQGGFTSL